MDEKRILPLRNDKRPIFRFLTHEEFAAMPQEDKVMYLTTAIRALSAKMNEVLAENRKQ